MFALVDTFNDRVVSRHKTLEAVAKAKDKFLRKVQAANGAGSYLPLGCFRLDSDGKLSELSDADLDRFFEAESRA